MTPLGIYLRHKTKVSQMVLVPIPTKPFPMWSWEKCPGCHEVHQFKTVHLMVNDSGLVIVSRGVFEDLQRAGMPELEVVGSTKNPPPLQFGASTLSFVEQRQKQDQEHRAITIGKRGGYA